MSYIRIANKADGVNRLYLEKLGLSTKRDNENTIGQFGSGSKFAPIAALRNDWEWINVGEDDIGPYKMEYVIKEEGGINCVYYLYDDEFLKPSSFVAEAGVLSWDSEFQIFREAFSNALDEFTEFGNNYSIEVVDEVKFEPGVFAVYLTADPALLSIIDNFNKYFSIKREPIAVINEKDKIYSPYDNECNFYYKGVLVHNDSTKLPMFNYEVPTITLNEERRVRNTYELNTRITRVFSYLNSNDPSHVSVAENLIHNANVDRWEWDIPVHNVETWFDGYNASSAFGVAWKNIHGDSVAVSSELMRFRSQFALRNVKTVEVKSSYLYAILKRCDVPCADSILGDEIEYEFVDLCERQKNRFDLASQIVKSYVKDLDRYVKEFKFFLPQGEQDRILGVANMNKNTVYLSVYAFDDLETLVGTIVHEYDHLSTELGDDDVAFRSIADNHIGKLLIKLYELEA
jgi:hypothetical protein